MNMSYCRFRNTLEDLRDCSDYINETIEDYDEEKARQRLIKLCREIASEFEEDDDE